MASLSISNVAKTVWSLEFIIDKGCVLSCSGSGFWRQAFFAGTFLWRKLSFNFLSFKTAIVASTPTILCRVLVRFLSTWHKLGLSEKRKPQFWKHTPSPHPRMACGQAGRGIFFIGDCCGRAWPVVVGAVPGQMVLGCIRKWFEQSGRSKLVCRVLPGRVHHEVPASTSPPWAPALVSLGVTIPTPSCFLSQSLSQH